MSSLDLLLYTIFAILIAFATGSGFGYILRDMREPHPNPSPEGNDPYPPEPDIFDRAIQAWLADSEPPAAERLADTGELQRLYGHPYPVGHADTGELRALAYDGDIDAIRRRADDFIASLNEED